MDRKFARVILAAAGLSAGTASATGKIEYPPGVPPEVDQARVSCPNIDGPCFGYFVTHWRVLPPCDAAPVLIPGPVHPGDLIPGKIPPARQVQPKPRVGTRLPAMSPERTGRRSGESPFSPVHNPPAEPAASPAVEPPPIRPIKHEVVDEPAPLGRANTGDRR